MTDYQCTNCLYYIIFDDWSDATFLLWIKIIATIKEFLGLFVNKIIFSLLLENTKHIRVVIHIPKS